MRLVFLLLFTFLAACGPTTPPDDAPQATIAVMAEIRPGTPLSEILEMLDRHLVNAMAGELEGDAGDEFLRAEAITDRLLEARMPFEWIPSENYSLESKLRQIQSSADRVMAQLRTGAPRPQMLNDLRMLRTDVALLRRIVAAGGEEAPVPVANLLAGDTAITAIGAPVEASGADNPASGNPPPLGTPVPPGGNAP